MELWLFIALFSGLSYCQQSVQTEPRTDVFRIRLDNRYLLSAVSILPRSEIIRLRGRFLNRGEYNIFYEQGLLQLSDSLPYSVFDTLTVTYQTLLIYMPKSYYKHKPEYRLSDRGKDSLLFAQPIGRVLSGESIFGKNLEKSGTLIRGFTVGTNRDLTVQSGFRLQLSGKLSDDIDITASLTDENSPIQPEGNTERLDELDKIFIQVKHPNVMGTFGDFDLQKQQGEFGIVNRKLQGLSAEVNYAGNSAFAAYAVARGKFNTNTMQGADAVQGPYQLLGRNNEKDIILIAGSERVYLNGELIKRGEQNDYSIDYGNAQLTFTQKNIITSASRIFVEFEYTDRRYTRNVFASGAGTSFFKNSLKLSFLYLRDADNQDSPIDVSLSEIEKQTLKSAGDNQQKAIKSGVTLAEIDTVSNLRKGLYQKIDSTANGSTITFYRYAPNTSGAWYNITFSYLGSTSGAYIKDAPGVFRYVGPGAGSYDTVLALPLPEMKQFSSLLLNWENPKDFSVSLEGAFSSLDKNRFSTIDDNDNTGFAGIFTFSLKPRQISLFSTSLGQLSAGWRERYLQNRFSPAERIGEVEFNRGYNVNESDGKQNEHLREITTLYSPVKDFENSLLYGSLSRGNDISSKRFTYGLTFGSIKNLKTTYSFDYAQSRNGKYVSNWYKHYGSTAYKLPVITPRLGFSAEDKRDILDKKDSVLNGSLKFLELRPGFESVPFQGLSLLTEYILRNDYSALSGNLEKEATSSGFNVTGEMHSGSVFHSNLLVSSLNKEYSPVFKNRGLLNSQIVLVKSQSRVNPFRQLTSDILYSVSTQKSAKLDRVFVQVTKGFGNYRYVGDLNNNGVFDENEYEPTLYDGDYSLITVPSDKLYPVIDIKTGVRFRYNFTGIFDSQTLPDNLVSPFTFESYSRIEENSTESDLKKMYLLQLGSFQKEATTIRGTNLFEQSVYIFENNPDLNGKLFYSMQKGLNQYGSGAEYSIKKEQSIRIKSRLVEEISNQTDLQHIEDGLRASGSSVRNRMIETNAVILDFSYRPYPFVEAGLKIKTSQSTDNFPVKPTNVNLNSQSVRINFSFQGAGRLRLEFERNELSVNEKENYLPFELTDGNGVGKNYFIRMNFDYRIAENLQSTANYDGRSISGSKLIHTMRAELRAFF
ncbi:MAG: hypothetical protein HYV28_12765 [Ignavibacteriales bacterium]|nr:hypothetical protein [Ignavibacteriales bacterium]